MRVHIELNDEEFALTGHHRLENLEAGESDVVSIYVTGHPNPLFELVYLADGNFEAVMLHPADGKLLGEPFHFAP